MTAIDVFAWFLVVLTGICIGVWAALAWLVLSSTVVVGVKLVRRKLQRQ